MPHCIYFTRMSIERGFVCRGSDNPRRLRGQYYTGKEDAPRFVKGADGKGTGLYKH